MGKTRNLNGDDVTEEETTQQNRNVQKKKMFGPFIRRISTEEEDDVFVDEDRGDKKMKKASKHRTILFIPGFRKSKKTHSDVLENGTSCEEMTPLRCKDRDTDSVLSKSSDDGDVLLNGSSRTSISSLDTLVSVDSGIDCGQISSTSSLSSVESLGHCDIMKGKGTAPRGRAPIASPEDDLLLDCTDVKSKKQDSSEYDSLTYNHNNSAASFCTLSDNSSCSCDSCCELDSTDSESEKSLQRTPAHSDSDSESDSCNTSGSRRRQHSDSDTDSDSDDDPSEDFFRPIKSSVSDETLTKSDKSSRPKKKLFRSNSKLNLSLKKLVRSGSKLDLSLKKIMRSNSKSDISTKKEAIRSNSKSDISTKKEAIRSNNKSDISTKKEAKTNIKLSVPQLKSSPKRVLPKLPMPTRKVVSTVLKDSGRNFRSSTPVADSSMSSIKNISSLSFINSSDVTINNSKLMDSFLRPRSDSDSSRGSIDIRGPNIPRPRSDSDSSIDIRGSNIPRPRSDSDSSDCSSFQGPNVQRPHCDSDSSDCSSFRGPNVQRPHCDIDSSDSISIRGPSVPRPHSDSNSSSDSFRGPNVRSGISLGNSIKTIKLQRSKSDSSRKQYPVKNHRLETFESFESCRTNRQILNNSPALQVRSRSILQNNCDIEIDTCKSPMEVRQAMEKTAFWIENNDYDKTPDVSSTESLLQTSRDVTESDLCNQIIGIYFGEENDSDSSLSSSCLDNSMETSAISDENATPPVTSTPLETNLDDFTMATFVPTPYEMAEAKTRKISKAEPIAECKVKQSEVKVTRRQKDVLGERVNNSVNKQRPVSDVPGQNRKSKMLSEEEIDTITKIHTICNGQRTVQYVNLNDIPVNFKHFPPPKRASRVVWNHDLCSDEAIHHTPPPSKLPVQTRPILQQKPNDFIYPYKEDEPSPIVITKVRRSKSLPRKSKEWPW